MLKQWVHLVSCEYSGSTLLSFILASHPKISSVGELAGWTSPDYKCSCGNIMKDCPLWAQVKERMLSKGYNYNFYNANLNVSPFFQKNLNRYLSYVYFYVFNSPSLEEYRNIFFKIFLYLWHKRLTSTVMEGIKLAQIICEIEGSEIFFDATKDYFRLKILYDKFKKPIKVIHLVRDGKAVVNSFIKRGFSYQKAINHWVKNNQVVEKLKNYYPNMEFFFLRYEDLCSYPLETLSKLSSFLGIENNFDLNKFDPKKFHIIGNSMRLKFNGQIRKPSNDLSFISLEVEREFERAASELYMKYGYVSS